MAAIEGLKQLLDELKKRAAEAAAKEANPTVRVGYTQAYALFVHENLEAHHPVGQAKFLEQPARTLQPVLAGIIREALRKKKKLSQALLLAGLRLQRESQFLVPIDTGALKGSAFTRLE